MRTKARFMVPVLARRGVNLPTNVSVPAAPTNFVATAAGPDQIDWTWDDNASNETGYRVERSPNGTDSWVTVDDTLPPNSDSGFESDLATGTEYFYRAFAFNANGDSAPSNVDSATPEPNVWEYATLAAAQTSGDSWEDFDIIRITDPDPDVDFLYQSSAERNGHQGLVHRDPHGTGNITSATGDYGQGPGTDPDTWGWSSAETNTGTQGVDYDFLVSGDKSRFIAYDTSGITFARKDAPVPSAAQASTWAIFRIFNINSSANTSQVLMLSSYGDGSTYQNTAQLLIDSNTTGGTTWRLREAGPSFIDTGLTGTNEVVGLWVYVNDNYASVWHGETLVARTSNPFKAGFISNGMVALRAACDTSGAIAAKYLDIEGVVCGTITE